MSDSRASAPSEQDNVLSTRALLKDATLEIRRLRALLAQTAAAPASAPEPIAIVGMACRFPGGADTPEAYWRLLSQGIDAITPTPPGRWDNDRYHDADASRAGHLYTRHGGFLDEVEGFDPQSFGISPREAEAMDPQQRLLLEVSHEALENAGLPPFGLKGSATGVYVGLCFDDYAQRNVRSGEPERIDAASALGTNRAIAAGRIAYTFGLQGPTMQLDTTCSSSLLALHLACQSLREGESNLALAGGVNLMLSPEATIAFCRLGALAPDGRCRTFDASAQGYARGEGCGMVVLKRLSDAQAAGDRVLAVLRSSAVNHDGASNGLTAPSGPAQTAVIRAALARVGLSPDDIQYVEAHGTATPLGDPIELMALNEAYGNRREPLWVGSVKTNIGHLESAAGVAGLMKVILSLQHGRIAPHLHFDTPNPRVPWSRLPLRVPRTLVDWPETTGPRRAGLSSFGMSGTNVHVVVEQAPATLGNASRAAAFDDAQATAPHVVALSARHAAGLQAQIERLASWVAAQQASADERIPPSLGDVAFSLNTGRSHGPYRQAVVATDLRELGDGLAAAHKASVDTRPAHAAPRVTFLFTGQGAQYVQMGHGLYERSTVFRQVFDRCAALADPHLPRPLASVVYPARGVASADIDSTLYTQPALFALQRALTELWRSWGVLPARVLGHSVGEYAAAVAAGIMSEPDAMRLLIARAQGMQALPTGGAMAVIQAPAHQVADCLPRGVEIAAFNGPTNTTVSGPEQGVADALAVCAGRDWRARRLPVSHAFHSALMQPMLEAFGVSARQVSFQPAQLDYVSSMSGQRAGDDAASAHYWVEQIRQPVHFEAALQTLAADPHEVCLEIGPQPVLLGLLLGTYDSTGPVPLALPSLRAPTPGRAARDTAQMLDSLAALYQAGAPIDWRQVHADTPGRRVPVPNSAFVRRRCWQDVPVPTMPGSRHGPVGRFPGQPLRIAGQHVQAFEVTLDASADTDRQDAPWHDHRVMGSVLLPAAAYLVAGLAAAPGTWNGRIRVENLVIERGLWLPADGGVCVQTLVSASVSIETATAASHPGVDQPHENAPRHIELHALEQGRWARHARAMLRHGVGDESSLGTGPDAWRSLRQACRTRHEPAELYRRFAERGIHYGAGFQALAEVHEGQGRALARLHDSAVTAALIDAGLQLAGLLLAKQLETWLPASIESFEAWDTQPAWVHAVERTATAACGERVFDVAWHLVDGRVVARMQGLVLRSLGASSMAPASEPQQPAVGLVEVDWLAQALTELAPLPLPAEVAAHARPRVEALIDSDDCAAYERLQPLLEQASLAWTLAALKQLGLAVPLPPVSTDADIGALATQLRIDAAQVSLFRRLITISRAASPADTTLDAQALQQTLSDQAPGRPEAALLGRCGAALAGILLGDVDALDLLFPQGDLSLLTRLYEDSPGARVMNEQVREAVRHAARREAPCATRDVTTAPAESGLRIIEIGAGTGGTTAHLLPLLAELAAQGRAVEYVFTDVSPHFLNVARERFAAHAFIRFSLLDIERPPADAALHGFDLVVASNVLHATADLGRTLEHVASLLRPSGLLVLLEATEPLRWLDLVFGTMPGWWLFDDKARRPEHPLLSVPQWRSTLLEHGFESSQALQGQRTLPQSVIVARRAPARAPSWQVLGSNAHVPTPVGELLRRAGASVHEGAHLAAGPSRDAVDAVVLVLPAAAPSDDDDPVTAVTKACALALSTVQALAALPQAPRLYVVSHHAGPASPAIELARAALWGFVQTVHHEHPGLRCTLLSTDDWPQAVRELLADGPETQVRLSQGRRQVARLRTTSAGEVLRLKGDGLSIASLVWQAASPRAPAPHELVVRVAATGLNFRDVLIAMGEYPHEDPAHPDPMGAECVGEVIAVGSAVCDVAPGTRVMAITPDSFSTEVTVPRALVTPIPSGLDWVQAATLPVAFATACHALIDCAQLARGDKVLIHSATGGVGQAAIQIAHALGAEVYATASPAKWSVLEGLGVRRVMDSRRTGFGAEIERLTEGRGVDVVLNALPGELQLESLAALQTHGRFIEIGKGAGLDDAGFATRAPGVAFFRVDLAAMCRHEPERVQSLLLRVAQQAGAGQWQPLPAQAFPHDQAVQALRTMQQARHVGKLVLTPPGSSRRPNASWQSPAVRAEGCHLITGGFGALGLLVAGWLVAQGARELVLAGRHGRPADEAAAALIDQWQAQGVRVHLRALDVADEAAVARLLDDIAGLREGIVSPLCGIVHAAGVLDDALLQQQDEARLVRVLAPKVAGAWHLHRLTDGQTLDYFVMFSSAAGLLGAPGQANHAAANAFLDGLAQWRRERGLAAQSIAWGAWSQVGAALRYAREGRVSGLPGVGFISPGEGLQWLERIWRDGRPALGVLPIDWRAFLMQPALRGVPLLASIAAEISAHADADAAPEPKRVAGALRQRLLVLDATARRQLIDESVCAMVAQTLGFPPHELDRHAGFFDLGLDSLTALELKNRLQSDLSLVLPATLAFDYPTPIALIGHLQSLFDQVGEGTVNAAAAPAIAPPATAVPVPAQDDRPLAQQLDDRLDALEQLLLDPPAP